MNEVRAFVFQRVLDRVCDAMMVRQHEVLGDSRTKDPALARQIVCYVLREHYGWTLAGIGEAVGRDPSTVSNNITRVAKVSKVDPEVAALVRSILFGLKEPAEMNTAARYALDVLAVSASVDTALSALQVALDRARQMNRELAHVAEAAMSVMPDTRTVA